MKKLRRVIVALIVTGCIATTAQAGIFSFFGDIINFFKTIIDDLAQFPKLAENTIAFTFHSVENLINVTVDSLEGKTMGTNLAQKPTYTQGKTSGTNTAGQQINQAYAGNSNTFSNQLNSYKSNTCSNGQCPTLTSNTLYNTNKLSSSTQANYAQGYVKNASGAGIGLAKPNQTAASPAVVKYSAYYNTQAAIQSNANNNMAAALSNRTPLNNSYSNESPLSFSKGSFENFNASQSYQNEIFGGGFILAPFLSGIQSLMTIPHLLGGASDSLDRINSGVSTLQSTGSQGMSYSVGNQLKASADQEDTGTPFKKQPHE